MQTTIYSVTTYSWSQDGCNDTPEVNLYDSKERAVKEAKWNLLNSVERDFKVFHHGHDFSIYEEKPCVKTHIDSFINGTSKVVMSRLEKDDDEYHIVVLRKH